MLTWFFLPCDFQTFTFAFCKGKHRQTHTHTRTKRRGEMGNGICVCQLLDFLLGQIELVHVSALSTEHVNCLHLTDGPRSSQFAVRSSRFSVLSSQFSVLDSQRRRCGRENRADALKNHPMWMLFIRDHLFGSFISAQPLFWFIFVVGSCRDSQRATADAKSGSKTATASIVGAQLKIILVA